MVFASAHPLCSIHGRCIFLANNTIDSRILTPQNTGFLKTKRDRATLILPCQFSDRWTLQPEPPGGVSIIMWPMVSFTVFPNAQHLYIYIYVYTHSPGFGRNPTCSHQDAQGKPTMQDWGKRSTSNCHLTSAQVNAESRDDGHARHSAGGASAKNADFVTVFLAGP